MVLLRHLRPSLIEDYCRWTQIGFARLCHKLEPCCSRTLLQGRHEFTRDRVDLRQPSTEAPFIKLLSSNGTMSIGVAFRFVRFLFNLNIARWRDFIMVKSVLIVDDNPIVRNALCELLAREEDFDVCGQAENGREAIEKAHQLCPDLIVTDLSMPVLNGLEETRLLRQLMPAVPVIIYTAHSDPFVEKEARAAGASAVISKSEAITTLVETARSLVDQ